MERSSGCKRGWWFHGLGTALLTMLVLAMGVQAAAQQRFSEFFYLGDDRGAGVAAVTGGGMVACGAQDGQAWIVRLDDCGQVVWQKIYPIGTESAFLRIIETAAGNFCTVGWAIESSDTDLYALCVQPDGAVIWQKTFGGTGSADREDVGWDLLELDGDRLVLAGYTSSRSLALGRDAWVLMVNLSTGNPVTQGVFGDIGGDEFHAVFQAPGAGDIVLLGQYETRPAIGHKMEMYVLRVPVNNLVAPLWQIWYGGLEDEVGYDGLALPDGTLILVGEESSSDLLGTGMNIWALRLSPNGGILWQRSYNSGNPVREEAFSVVQSPTNGQLLIAGLGDADPVKLRRDSEDMLLLAVNPINGALLWNKFYDSRPGDAYADEGYSVAVPAGGDILLGGSTFNPPLGIDFDWWVLKLDPNGDVVGSPTPDGICSFEDAGLVAVPTTEIPDPLLIAGGGINLSVASYNASYDTALTLDRRCVAAGCP